MSLQKWFLQHVGQTNEWPLALEVDRAEGIYIYDVRGKRFMDMNSGIAVSSLGHCHPRVIAAIEAQLKKHMHTMVYGEHIQSPQVAYARMLTAQLDPTLNALYFLTTGTEATEVAMKLAKRYTGRTEIVACRNAYHGSTQGSESLRSDEAYKRAFMPLLPDIRHIRFNHTEDLALITIKTAAVVFEVVQAEAGIILPDDGYLRAVRQRCDEVGCLMILDEIQTGFGRTGRLFAHQKYSILPDVLLVGKAMAGGMPLSGVVASQEVLRAFVRQPALGHITTFGGHPVACAAALAALDVLLTTDLIDTVTSKSDRFKAQLAHPIVQEVRGSGLLMAVELTRRKYLKHVVAECMKLGLIVDWFLFNDRCFRLAPPLIVSEEAIDSACAILQRAFDYAQSKYA